MEQNQLKKQQRKKDIQRKHDDIQFMKLQRNIVKLKEMQEAIQERKRI